MGLSEWTETPSESGHQNHIAKLKRLALLVLVVAALAWGVVLLAADGTPWINGCDKGEQCQPLHLDAGSR